MAPRVFVNSFQWIVFEFTVSIIMFVINKGGAKSKNWSLVEIQGNNMDIGKFLNLLF